MGIGYNDSIILYNQYESQTLGTQLYFGTRFDGVRVELTQGANIQASGLENADSCKVKIPNKNLPKPYIPPEAWDEKTVDEMAAAFTVNAANGDFFVIVHKDGLNIDIDLPVGQIDSDDYRGGFFQWVKNKYGHAYQVHTLDVYQLIPRFEIGGR